MPIVGETNHPKLGRVIVSIRINSRRASARWRNGLVYLNVPATLCSAEINNLLDQFTPKLLACRPTLRYTAPMQLNFSGVEFLIRRQNFAPTKILTKISISTCVLEIGNDIDLDTDLATRSISKILCLIAHKIAPTIILPRARVLASKLGCRPADWKISKGFRTLGTCSSTGVISLSYAILFLPDELRDYIICHELAHLTEMNHSPRFHQLLNRYLDGRESILTAQLRKFQWPVLRR